MSSLTPLFHDRFRGKTWIYWPAFLFCTALGLFGVIVGPLFWTGTIANADGRHTPEAGPPLTFVGIAMLLADAVALYNIVARIAPIIRCYRDGIECNLIGANSLNELPLLPGLIRETWGIVSLQAFRLQQVRIPWTDFHGAQIDGLPLSCTLTLHGRMTNRRTGQVRDIVIFRQVELVENIELVAGTLNLLAANAVLRDPLPSWDGAGCVASSAYPANSTCAKMS